MIHILLSGFRDHMNLIYYRLVKKAHLQLREMSLPVILTGYTHSNRQLRFFLSSVQLVLSKVFCLMKVYLLVKSVAISVTWDQI